MRDARAAPCAGLLARLNHPPRDLAWLRRVGGHDRLRYLCMEWGREEGGGTDLLDRSCASDY
jgi:hypothetical protein